MNYNKDGQNKSLIRLVYKQEVEICLQIQLNTIKANY